MKNTPEFEGIKTIKDHVKTAIKLIVGFPIALFFLFLCVRLFDHPQHPIMYATGGFDFIVKDKTTGNPLPGALVTIQWKNDILWGLDGTTTNSYKTLHAMSDENGLVKVPSAFSTHFLSNFAFISAEVTHPLYQHFSGFVYRWPDQRKKSQQQPLEESFLKAQTSATLELLSLEEKYKDANCTADQPEGVHMNQVCDQIGSNLFSDIQKAKQYYFLTGRNLQMKSLLKNLPDHTSTVDKWHEISVHVYRNSPTKPAWINVKFLSMQ